jgi:hypothetical protein
MGSTRRALLGLGVLRLTRQSLSDSMAVSAPSSPFSLLSCPCKRLLAMGRPRATSLEVLPLRSDLLTSISAPAHEEHGLLRSMQCTSRNIRCALAALAADPSLHIV